ncbi:hypothetical protein I6U51_07765 [Clostridium aciditolerans]|uniref:Uncharacterized protein n=1 Tax=Clostridium aciditolerans TaxID=339861 RepID=A0A934M2Y3_9CLOT|nr:hypothetical protein [Clostridium aciditolerans]
MDVAEDASAKIYKYNVIIEADEEICKRYLRFNTDKEIQFKKCSNIYRCI